MPTNVTEFGGACYAVAYRLHGGRLVALGSHRADRPGVRRWLAAAGHPRSGWQLVPAAGTPPGFYAKPYLAGAYDRLDPPTGAFVRVGASLFDDRRPGDERGGTGGAAVRTRAWRRVPPARAGGQTVPHPLPRPGEPTDAPHPDPRPARRRRVPG